MFAKVTEQNGRVHWINLAHVRDLVVVDGKHGMPTLTEVHIDNNWVERVFSVVETPETIVGQSAG